MGEFERAALCVGPAADAVDEMAFEADGLERFFQVRNAFGVIVVVRGVCTDGDALVCEGALVRNDAKLRALPGPFADEPKSAGAAVVVVEGAAWCNCLGEEFEFGAVVALDVGLEALVVAPGGVERVGEFGVDGGGCGEEGGGCEEGEEVEQALTHKLQPARVVFVKASSWRVVARNGVNWRERCASSCKLQWINFMLVATDLLRESARIRVNAARFEFPLLI